MVEVYDELRLNCVNEELKERLEYLAQAGNGG